ncbi:hypothetical protein [Leptothrix discophora]|uniref:Uncharacterized protein n=1 Tax=Leptothrix discophora TaxID=89 RepID=A0ABT9G0C3_LEPDI|nr:hypothetical protein [Leptothrix discophora]MDP4299916.1 hypothetical protein [Leptothrix discophora]
MKLLKDIFTEQDGTSFELLAVLGGAAVVVALGLQIYVTVHTGQFDLMNFGTGIGVLFVAVGGGQKLKPQANSQ